MRLPFLIQHATQNLAALLCLPDLIWVLVLVELEKFLVGFERRLGLSKIIVAESADKPLACTGSFGLGKQFLCSQGGGPISSEIVGRSQVLPIDHIIFVELQSGLNFFFGVRKVAPLHVNAAKAAVELRVVGRENDGFAKSDDGIVPFFLSDLNVGARAERIKRGRLA